ncbi:hypothetical protein FB382_002997 [Nocardioides ginsengisegetis]|uniref:FlgD Ig-like domain-containing protein n=1 Tax=Nocardioides ginsengisegetis TaxID=661491 RepID=A0A7W3J1U1_9ACTN|nr:hypothetical protein [Nocardioides ginsengisegetis]MBA8804706.1 hypothetical protein [Nocardioides ginsengisegetis]
MSSSARLLACLVTLLAVVLGFAQPAALADDPTQPAAPVVTWPEMTAFNPGHTPYVVTVDDSANDPATDSTVLVAEIYAQKQPLADQGETTIAFPAHSTGHVTVNIRRCQPDLVTCSEPLATRTVLLVRWLKVNLFTPVDAAPGTHTAWMDVFPVHADTADWQLVDPSTDPETVVDEGSTPLADGRSFEYTIPATLADQTHLHLRVTASNNAPEFGHVAGSDDVSGIVVHSAPPEVTLKAFASGVYWARDGYLDEVPLVVRSWTGRYLTLDLVAADGTVTTVKDHAPIWHRWNTVYRGIDGKGGHLPNGRYRLRVSVEDSWGNVGVASTPFTVSDRRTAWRTWSHTYTAQGALLRELVGRCSTISHHPSYGWTGGLGLYSRTKCTKAAQSYAIAENGISLPKALGYDGLRVTAFGGGPRGSSGTYAVLGYYRERDDEFVQRVQFNGVLGDHAGQASGPANVWNADTNPTFYWSLGLTQGSRWEVRSYKVTARLRVFR